MGDIVRREGDKGPRFYVRYRDADGKRKQRAAPSGPTPRSEAARRKAAEAYLAAIETNIRNGRAGLVEPTPEEQARKSITVAALVDRFLAEYAPPRIKDLDSYRKQARTIFKVRIVPTLGKRAAASVAGLDVERLRDAQLADKYAAWSVEGTLRFVSRLYTWGRRVGAIDCANPVTGCERPRTTSSIDFLDGAEVGSLLAHAEEHAPDLYPMIATGVYAGLRKGELYGLRWRDVDLDAGRLTVARSYAKLPKSGKVRHLPLHPDLARILRAWRDRCPKTDDGLIFPVAQPILGGYRMGNAFDGANLGDDVVYRTKEVKRGILFAAGCHVPAKPWHSLRHTFASHFMMAGGNILTLQKLLGHADLKMTLIYAHLAPDFMKAEVARIRFAPPARADVADLGEARRAREAGE